MFNSSQWHTLRSTDDRSSTLRHDARSADAFTARSSFDYHPSTKRNTSGLSHLKQGALPTRSLTALSTPHDRILEEMYNHPGESEGALPLPSELDSNRLPLDQAGDQLRASPAEANTRSHSANEPANYQEGAASATPAASLNSHAFPGSKLYDPFDGSPLGIVVPVEINGGNMPTQADSSSNEELWTHLSRVLDLQNQIARMHVDMEGVGPGKQADGKGKGPLGNTPKATAFTRLRTTSTGSVPGADIGDEEGVGVADEEAGKLKAREREFKKLATQFEGRKEAINEMMGTLDDLSKTLTEFHSLQAPKIEFPSPSRNNSLSPNIGDHIQMPSTIPPSDPASPFSPGESGIQSSFDSTSYPPPPPLGVEPNISSDSRASTRLLSASLGRKGPIPNLIINSIEPDSQTHVVDSPVSTASFGSRQDDGGR
ncbi:hypothetical protein P691DRAFT_798395 [Macrolepiota fuliginosa MF-IS2]|uniref:Uncharacterized protein n=1 Tax=Macrolepiota fuliginosa MF-IS2 TaxID=1400762 RepID=A0A9P5XMH3_9AGAR|nr:hypothetical protein P691DRAFT_798395 [Macrolepiota fuliginosa MF-IS2]